MMPHPRFFLATEIILMLKIKEFEQQSDIMFPFYLQMVTNEVSN
jgi:hypothetical protein